MYKDGTLLYIQICDITVLQRCPITWYKVVPLLHVLHVLVYCMYKYVDITVRTKMSHCRMYVRLYHIEQYPLTTENLVLQFMM